MGYGEGADAAELERGVGGDADGVVGIAFGAGDVELRQTRGAEGGGEEVLDEGGVLGGRESEEGGGGGGEGVG